MAREAASYQSGAHYAVLPQPYAGAPTVVHEHDDGPCFLRGPSLLLVCVAEVAKPNHATTGLSAGSPVAVGAVTDFGETAGSWRSLVPAVAPMAARMRIVNVAIRLD